MSPWVRRSARWLTGRWRGERGRLPGQRGEPGRARWRASAPLALLLVGALGLAALASGCDEPEPIRLDYNRAGPERQRHVFPTDDYLSDERVEAFSEEALAALPFLRQLRLTGLRGYGGAVAIRIPFTPAPQDPERWLDAATLEGAIRVYRVSSSPPVPVSVAEIALEPRTNTVTVRPRRPWAPGTYGVAVLTDQIATRDGERVGPSPDQARVRAEGDTTTSASFAAVAEVDPHIARRSDTLAYFQFTVADTVSATRLLESYVAGKVPVIWRDEPTLLEITPFRPAAARQIAVGDAEVAAEGDHAVAAWLAARGVTGLDTSSIGRVVTGGLATPTFLSDPIPDVQALFTNGTFRGQVGTVPYSADNPLVASRSAPSRVVPYLAVYPREASPGSGVVVFMHGFSRSRLDMLALAPALTRAGFVVVAIDAYQHGARQRDVAHPEGDTAYGLDPGLMMLGEAFPDPFINPTFLARTRDRLRQIVVDHLALIRVLAEADGAQPLVDLDGDGVPDDLGPIHLVGFSLGAMVGTVVAALSPEVERVVLSVPGGSLAQVMAESPALSANLSTLIYLLANAPGFGLLPPGGAVMLPGTSERELYDRVAESITSAVDPLVFAPGLLNGTLGNARPRVLVQLAARDLVVPFAAGARLVRALASGASAPEAFPQRGAEHDLGLPVVDALTGSGVSVHPGGHRFLLEPGPARDAAQAELVDFLTAP